jgi:TPP-dependent pyruvate/acetoin dehydrogenase alpha subunit
LLNDKTVEAAKLDSIDAQVQKEIDDAVEFAKQAPYPDPSDLIFAQIGLQIIQI